MTLLELNDFLVKGRPAPKKPAMTHSDLGGKPQPRRVGHQQAWNEQDHPRDGDGQFAHSNSPKQPTTLEGQNALYMSVGRGANGDTRKAKAASAKADDTNSRADHNAAAVAHDQAAKSHKKAFTLAGQSKLPEAAKIHMSLEKYHIDLFKYHKARS